MPASPALAEELAQAIHQLYSAAEARLFGIISRRLARGIDTPGWADAKLREIGAIRREIEGVITDLSTSGALAVQEAIAEAYERGSIAALRDLRAVLRGDPFGPLFEQRAVQALVSETVLTVQATHTRILRQGMDVYRSTIAEVTGEVLAGSATRRQAAQTALSRFASTGISGFVDKAGRNWDLATYSEMAVRTASGRAAVQGHADRLIDNGRDLVIVSSHSGSCPLCADFQGEILSLTGRTPGYVTLGTARASGLQHPNCVVGGQLVSGPKALRSYSRWYEGETINLATASGNKLTVTPNHPVLTTKGWVAAGLLNKGDSVIRYLGQERTKGHLSPDDEQVPALIEEVVRAVGKGGHVSPVRVPTTAEHFHGDGRGSDVCVVRSDSLLGDRVKAVFGEPAAQHLLRGAARWASPSGALSALSAAAQFLEAVLAAPNGIMGSGGQGLALCNAHAAQARAHRFTSVRGGHYAALTKSTVDDHLRNTEISGDGLFSLASLIPPNDVIDVQRDSKQGERFLARTQGNITTLEASPDRQGGDAEGGRDWLDSFTGQIATDDIVRVEHKSFNGHVYNLETSDGWYACNSIITHNCRHSIGIYLPGVTRPANVQPERDRARDYAVSQQQRYNERTIRRWRRRETVAITEQERVLSARKVAEWQAAQRQFTEEHGLRRKYERERVGAR